MYTSHHSIILALCQQINMDLRTQFHINAFILFPWDLKWNKILGIIVPLILWAGGNSKLLTLLSGSVTSNDNETWHQPSLVPHTIQTLWWVTIDAGLCDWIVWASVSQEIDSSQCVPESQCLQHIPGSKSLPQMCLDWWWL